MHNISAVIYLISAIMCICIDVAFLFMDKDVTATWLTFAFLILSNLSFARAETQALKELITGIYNA